MIMPSRAWLRLENFKVPFSLRVKCMFARLLTLGRIKPDYRCHNTSVSLKVEFEGEYLELVVEHFRRVIREWGKQNNIVV